jgi:RNA polymerase sigma-70 factor, ECF subfamily
VFLSLLSQPDRFDPNRGPLRTFLFAVARNLALKKLRDENRWDVIEDEQFIAEPVDIALGETTKIVEAAVKALPPLQREVLVLAEYEELSLEEIARTVESEVGTVKARPISGAGKPAANACAAKATKREVDPAWNR